MASIHSPGGRGKPVVHVSTEPKAIFVDVAGAWLQLDAEEADSLGAELQRAAQQLRIGAASAQQYTDALNPSKAEAA